MIYLLKNGEGISMREITTSIYTFEDIIKGNCIYVDKTRYIYQLLKKAKAQIFCSRPRRFGKSLTVSTLEAIFNGKRELFKGLYIDGTDYDWSIHPVIHIDFANGNVQTLELLTLTILDALRATAKSYGVSLQGNDPVLAFRELIEQLYDKTGSCVVLLIDEYDKPILEHIGSMKDAEQYRDFIANFYQIIKGSERYLRFTFVTGITKFSKVSIFSKLNNLYDISMDSEYSTMFGYTQEELEANFAEYIDAAVKKKLEDDDGTVLDRRRLLDHLREWYDGFCFAPGCPSVYNPVSIGSFFQMHFMFKNYWYDTGTPTFLMKVMRHNHLTVLDIANITLSETALSSFDLADVMTHGLEDQRIAQLLLQSGYLTIAGLKRRTPELIYRLRFPNHEVAYSFEKNLLSAYAASARPSDYVEEILDAADEGNTLGMINALKGFFSALPYDIQIPEEKYYQSIVYTIFRMCGLSMNAEVKTNIGRIDGVLDAGEHLYIIEFKLNKSADAALNQIDEKAYADGFIIPAKEKDQVVHKLGINFCYDEKLRNIADWKEDIIGK